MKLEGRLYCDGPGCERSERLGLTRFDDTGKLTSLPPGSLMLTRYSDFSTEAYSFCGTDCLMKWAADHPPEVVIPLVEPGEGEADRDPS